MFCTNCFRVPWFITAATTTPLLSTESVESVETLLQRLHKRATTLNLQAQQYYTQSEEARLSAHACAKKGDRRGARHHLEEARKADYYYDQELKHLSNTKEIARKLREAMVNAETVRNMSAANTTLEQLQQAMPLHALDDIMDAFQDNSLMVKQQSEILSAQPFDVNGEDVDAELETLMANAVKLPEAPNSTVDSAQNDNHKVALKET